MKLKSTVYVKDLTESRTRRTVVFDLAGAQHIVESKQTGVADGCYIDAAEGINANVERIREVCASAAVVSKLAGAAHIAQAKHYVSGIVRHIDVWCCTAAGCSRRTTGERAQ